MGVRSKIMNKILIIVVVVLFLNGCVTTGKMFQFKNVSQLDLGNIKSNEYKDLFGKPQFVSTETNDNGRYEKATYYLSNVNCLSLNTTTRRLVLEFKDGILNGYDYISGFKKDKTQANLTEIERVKIKQSTKMDVLKFFGTPTGKALCPSTLYRMPTINLENGDEIWSWQALDNSILQEASTQLFIIFDQNELVTKTATFNKENK